MGKQLWSVVQYYPGIWLERVQQTVKSLNQASWSPSQDSCWGLQKLKQK